jgi:hypothetical protein
MRLTVTKALSAFLAGCALLTGLAYAQAGEVVLKFKDGKTIQGEFVSEDAEKVVIAISTIPTTYKKSDIISVQKLLSVDEEFKQKKSALKPDDYSGWYSLAYWLYTQKSYQQSINELDALSAALGKAGKLKDADTSLPVKVKTLRELALGEMNKSTATTAAKPPVKPASTPGATTQPGSTAAGATGIQAQYADRRMTDAQLNMIRLYEIGDPETERPVVQIKREALDSFINTYKDKPDGIKNKQQMNDFLQAPPWFQLSLFFKNRARELYPSVTVIHDPPTMLAFKKIHSTYIMNYCGTANCHGGAEAGNLFFFTLDAASPRSVYSNFFNLYTWQDNTGYMINLNNPGDSYLLQYGQPNTMKNAIFQAKKPHPEVKGWAPKFLTLDNPLQKTIEEWIITLGTNRVDFGIDYVPPVVSPGAKAAQRTYSPVPAATSGPAPEEPKKAVPR